MIIQAVEYELRSFREDDVMAFYDLAHDELVKRYVPYAYPKTLEEAYEMVEDYVKGDCENDFYLLIQYNESLIGMIIAVRIKWRTLEVSAFIAPKYRGKGIMTTAMKAFIKWLSDNTDYKQLVMFIEEENSTSNCQIRKIGGICSHVYEQYNVYTVTIK